MSQQPAIATAQILDFAEYRQRRMARGTTPSLRTRRFLWGWPGHAALVDFPAPAAASAPSKTRSI
jgi:hypothetical protein